MLIPTTMNSSTDNTGRMAIETGQPDYVVLVEKTN
jgi:hypothetical protein